MAKVHSKAKLLSPPPPPPPPDSRFWLGKLPVFLRLFLLSNPSSLF